MDPQMPVQNVAPAPVEVPPQPQPTVPASNSNNFVVIFMSVVLLLLIGLTGFLYYQNQQLKGMLTSQSSNQPISQSTNQPSPTPDPTANWKTYTNKSLGIEFKYPENYVVLKETPNVELGFGIGTEVPVTYITISKKLTDFSLYKTCSGNDSTPCFNNVSWNQTDTIANIKVDGNYAKSIYYTSGVDTDTHVIQTATPQKLEIKMNIAGGKLDYNFQQILSTFKFISPSASPSASPSTKPVACTMEAKICPDGSSVGRTGPNCEFAACHSSY